MFDIGWQELFVIGAIGLIVVGPKDLPRVLRQVTKYVRKARSIAREFQSSIDEVVRETELDDIRKQVEAGGLNDIGGDIKKSLEFDLDDDYGDQFRNTESTFEDTAKTDETPAVEKATEPEPAAEPAAEEPKPAPAAEEPKPETPAADPQPAAKAAKSPDSASG